MRVLCVLAVPGTTSVPMPRTSDGQGSPGTTAVLRRQKTQQSPLAEEERIGRRVSYLKATWGDRMHVDSDFDLSDGESPHVHHRSSRKWRPPLFPEDIQRLKRIFEEMSSGSSSPRPPARRAARHVVFQKVAHSAMVLLT
ncbi:Uncharacterized protein GBIM_12092 [Gryllus bimaculatus]|nr:Uncharacterized protein GBIM_12092 [Gryllus bimaculatus]